MRDPMFREFSPHPAAQWFPLLDGQALADLAADIRDRGLLEPLTVHGDVLLDGRNRLRACEMAGVAPRYVEWDGEGDPVAWIVSKNLHRRHLDTAQRAMIGARLLEHFRPGAEERRREHAGTAPGRQADTSGKFARSDSRARDDAARAVNVSPRSVEHASRVLERGVPELVEAVEAGEGAGAQGRA